MINTRSIVMPCDWSYVVRSGTYQDLFLLFQRRHTLLNLGLLQSQAILPVLQISTCRRDFIRLNSSLAIQLSFARAQLPLQLQSCLVQRSCFLLPPAASMLTYIVIRCLRKLKKDADADRTGPLGSKPERGLPRQPPAGAHVVKSISSWILSAFRI